MTIILICGGRTLDPREVHLWLAANFFNNFPLAHEIISGKAAGADTGAELFAEQCGLKFTGVAADWENFPKSAGPIRNREMLKLGPHAVLAFPGGRGTNDMIAAATKKFVPVWKVIGDFGNVIPHRKFRGL